MTEIPPEESAGREQFLGDSRAVCCLSNHGNSAGKQRGRGIIRGFWESEKVEDFDFLPLLGLEGQKSCGNEFPCVYPWIIFLGI